MTLPSDTDWQPAAALSTLRLRARLLARTREFFARRAVLEVETPVLSAAATPDPALSSFRTRYRGPGAPAGQDLYLHTSPEFPMKRLLAAGSGDIYQLCRVFRDEECGRRHNPEFTLLEWYRLGLDHHGLMDEVEALLIHLLDGLRPLPAVQRISYADLFEQALGLNPHRATAPQWRECAQRHGLVPPTDMQEALPAWRDFFLTHVIEPGLPAGAVLVYDYPADQAALARVRPGSPPLASRFELYLNGVELANGFHELTDSAEQQRRFELENAARPCPVPVDQNLLDALRHGLPDCAGVALGFDRLVMAVAGVASLQEVLAFPLPRA